MNGNLEFSFESKDQELTRIKIAINIKPRRRTWVFSLIFLQPFENRLSVHNNRHLLYFLLFILTKGEKFPNCLSRKEDVEKLFFSFEAFEDREVNINGVRFLSLFLACDLLSRRNLVVF